ncbi:MAG TPA: hypothetical protein VGI92_05875 [Gemmatimonadales bacterium]
MTRSRAAKAKPIQQPPAMSSSVQRVLASKFPMTSRIASSRVAGSPPARL